MPLYGILLCNAKVFFAYVLAGRASRFPHEEAPPGKWWRRQQQLMGLAAGGGTGVLGEEGTRAGSGTAQTYDPKTRGSGELKCG